LVTVEHEAARKYIQAELLQRSGRDGDYFNISIFHALIRSKYINNQQNALQYLWCISFTMFSPTYFGWCSGHLQGDVIIAYYTINKTLD